MKLQDRVVVITGAASGIGRALAIVLSRRGCRLALADIDASGLAETARQVSAEGTRPSCHCLDVADRQAVAELPAAVLAAQGRVDVLINNAGVALGGTFEQVSEADFDWLMEINFHGLVRMTRAFLPSLHQSDDACIVNLSSVFGLIAPPGQCAYSAAKFAVRGFSNALRHELAGTTVGVTVVHPGGIATEIARSARAPAGASDQEVQEQVARFDKMLRMPAASAAEIIVRAIEQRRARVLVGLDARIASLLERLAPVHYWRLLGRLAKP